MYELLRTFKREGIENFVITKKKYVDVILSDYKRVLKENEELEEINNELEAVKNEAIRRYNFETIPIKKVKDKIKILENLQNEFLNNEELTVKIIAYKELIEEREENKVCKYCKLFSGDEITLAEDGETELKIERHNKEYSLIAEGLTDNAEIRINYCPECGRKLVKE